MMELISRIFGFGDRVHSRAGSSTVSSEFTDRDIENYYLRIISDCLARMLVLPADARVSVKRVGLAPSGLSAFSGFVEILRWHPLVTPVLLQNLPVVDARLRSVIRASVILEHTHFAGLWFQASSNAAGSPTALLGVPCELIHQPGLRRPL